MFTNFNRFIRLNATYVIVFLASFAADVFTYRLINLFPQLASYTFCMAMVLFSAGMVSDFVRHHPGAAQSGCVYKEPGSPDVWNWMWDRDGWEKDKKAQWKMHELMPRIAMGMFFLFSSHYGLSFYEMDHSNQIGFVCSLACFVAFVVHSTKSLIHYGTFCYNITKDEGGDLVMRGERS